MTAAERAHKQAEEDLNHYLKVGRAMAEENAAQSLKSSAFYLESAREELKQLQKMYRDKDLTEETEEIILKRQRHAVAMAELSYKHALIHHEQTLKVTIPRQEQANRDNAAKAALAWEKAKSSLPLALTQKRLALAKLKYDQAKAEEKLRNVQKDREALIVRAPADGIVYYGKCLRGQWTTAATVAPKLQRGGTLTPDEVFMTIVSPGPLFVRATVEEKDLHVLQPGLKGMVIPTGFPDIKLPARLARLVPIPQGAGSFEARVTLEKEAGDRLVPGLACSVKFLAYRKDKALAVPASAVFEEDAEGETSCVYLMGPGAKPEKRSVKIGKTAEGKTEILAGLREGEIILTSKPDSKALGVPPTKPSTPEK
jgi:multidrug efflux pump subunit AcrA (membrane-fusion protein)